MLHFCIQKFIFTLYFGLDHHLQQTLNQFGITNHIHRLIKQETPNQKNRVINMEMYINDYLMNH